MEKALPPIPAKRYFTIGEVSALCGVKPYVLRYWEQEFAQLKPMKRRGNRRYYQHHEVLLVRRIRELLYDQGFTISGARNRLADALPMPDAAAPGALLPARGAGMPLPAAGPSAGASAAASHALAAAARGKSARAEMDVALLPVHPRALAAATTAPMSALEAGQLRAELLSIRDLLGS
jgi:DNA-binding transcriptional MerR regulator